MLHFYVFYYKMSLTVGMKIENDGNIGFIFRSHNQISRLLVNEKFYENSKEYKC